MRRVIHVLSLVLCSIFINAQSTVNITINHLLESEPFENEVQAVNNLENNFFIDRLQYYLSGFSITHDGGNVIEIPDHYVLVDLLNKTDPITIELGEHSIQSLEGVRFHLGIDYDNNHADPASWDSDHPLAPKSPSMHWGWAAGYRFIALEGKSGPSIDQEMQFHCIGDEFYQPISFEFSMQNETNYNVVLNAEYSNLLKDIDVSSGIIVHGPLGEIIPLANNLIEEVFSLDGLTSSINEEEEIKLKLYPNPSDGSISILYGGTNSDVNVDIYNMLGESIYQNSYASNQPIEIENSGMYIAVLSNTKGEVIAQRKFIIK